MPFQNAVSREKHFISVFKPKAQYCAIPSHETKDLSKAYTKLGHKKEVGSALSFEKQLDRDKTYLMKNLCGEGYKNVLRDNERKEFMEQFMLKKPKRTKKINSIMEE